MQKKPTKTSISRENRIKKEIKKLDKAYEDISEKEKIFISSLILKAATSLVDIEDMEKDIVKNGRYEMFSQSAQAIPYERERPIVKNYYSESKNYQNYMNQLQKFVPREQETEFDDGFDDL